MNTINYFIAETDLPQQNNNQAYGPVSSSEYRVTSVFTGGNNPMAFAVTDGEIFIVNQDNNPTRVNLVLKPDNLPFGVPVKYFLYRGLLKSDFLDKDNSYQGIRPASNDDSDFIKKLRKGLNGELALDLFENLEDDYFINQLLLKDDFQFALVKQGDSIGRFDSLSDYGFEIILDETFYEPTLGIARKETNIIEVSTVPDETEVSKLKVLNYIDPAAYFGFFSHTEFSIGTNNSQSPKKRAKEGIYEFVSRFATKNTVYIDIRDLYQNPIDWFEDSPKDIKATTDGTSAIIATSSPYRNLNAYPLRIIQTGSSNPLSTESDQPYFLLKLSLPLSNVTTPLLNLQSGYWVTWVDKIEEDEHFSICEDDNGWSDDKVFIVFGAKDSGNTNVPVATYLRMQLSEYVDIEAIKNQIPNDNDENSVIDFNLQGVFAFNVEGLPEYQPPTI